MPPASAVIDPNVLLSALMNPAGGNPAEVVHAVTSGELIAIVSPVLLAQLDETVRRPKFRRRFTLTEGWALRGLLEATGEWYSDPPAGPMLTRDPTDDYLVRLYEVSGADWLIPGTKISSRPTWPHVTVLNPARAVARLAGRRR